MNDMAKLKELWPHVFIATAYLAVVSLAYWYAAIGALYVLTIPWSVIPTIFGWLLIHMFSGGMDTIMRLELTGALANVVFYLLIVYRTR